MSSSNSYCQSSTCTTYIGQYGSQSAKCRHRCHNVKQSLDFVMCAAAAWRPAWFTTPGIRYDWCSDQYVSLRRQSITDATGFFIGRCNLIKFSDSNIEIKFITYLLVHYLYLYNINNTILGLTSKELYTGKLKLKKCKKGKLHWLIDN